MQVQDKPIALKWVGPSLDCSIQNARDPSDASDASEGAETARFPLFSRRVLNFASFLEVGDERLRSTMA